MPCGAAQSCAVPCRALHLRCVSCSAQPWGPDPRQCPAAETHGAPAASPVPPPRAGPTSLCPAGAPPHPIPCSIPSPHARASRVPPVPWCRRRHCQDVSESFSSLGTPAPRRGTPRQPRAGGLEGDPPFLSQPEAARGMPGPSGDRSILRAPSPARRLCGSAARGSKPGGGHRRTATNRRAQRLGRLWVS